MDQVESFSFEDLGDVRCNIRDEAPWFVAQDVCDVLGIKNVKQAISKLFDDEHTIMPWNTFGGEQHLLTVSESGLYILILRSRSAMEPGTVACRFRRWVTAEVLPSIRQTGHYSVSQKLANDTDHLDNKAAFIVMVTQWKAYFEEAWRLRQLRRYGKTWN